MTKRTLPLSTIYMQRTTDEMRRIGADKWADGQIGKVADKWTSERVDGGG